MRERARARNILLAALAKRSGGGGGDIAASERASGRSTPESDVADERSFLARVGRLPIAFEWAQASA